MNRYLRDRADRRRSDRAMRGGRGMDRARGRGSDSRTHVGGYYRDSRYDRRYDERGSDYGYDRNYDRGYDYGYDYGNDYGYDYRGGRDYNDYGDEEEEYHKHIKKLTEKLKKKDRFGMGKEEVIKNAEKMGVKFNEYNEDEFYLTYLMQVTDYPGMNEPQAYIVRAKQFLEDDDVMRRGSDKLCAYIYSVVLGDDD